MENDVLRRWDRELCDCTGVLAIIRQTTPTDENWHDMENALELVMDRIEETRAGILIEYARTLGK